MRIIAPSILAANFLDLEEEINKINNSVAKWIHFDVMDGHFVPNLSFGPDIFAVFKENSSLFTDVHIMVSNPLFVGNLFIEKGADQIVFHHEACQNDNEIKTIIDEFKAKGIKVGIAIKPETKVSAIENYLHKLDLVLVMAVEPGFGNQKFMNSALDKIKELNDLRALKDLPFLIQADGGINADNKDLCFEAGADCLVAGSYLFKQDDFNEAVASLL